MVSDTTDDRARYVADVVLADGGTVRLRPIRTDDRDKLSAFHAGLSAQSIYYRFFSPKPRLSDKELTRFTTVDFVDRVALVAELDDALIAVARYDRWPGVAEAEVAFTVRDEHQGRGLSTLLLEHLAEIARQHGITRFTAEVLPDNRPMLGVFRRAGFDVESRFAGGVVDVAFDIASTPAFVESVEEREQRAESRSIARLLAPRSIAVIGATDRAGSLGRAVFRNLLASDFDGPVYPVSDTSPHVASVTAHASVMDISDDIHLAVIAVPAENVVGVVEQCGRKKVRGVLVLSAGFSDVGPEGAELERELLAIARRSGMRMIGPASLGIITSTATSKMHASFAPAGIRPGRVAISLQSGPLGTALLDLAARVSLGISTFVSLGNKADVSANDFLNYWFDDPATDVVLIYTESFGNPRKFGRIARRVSRRKPIVAVKSHGGPAENLAAAALYDQAGVIRVTSVMALVDVGRLLADQPLPGGDRVAVVSNAASPAKLAVDSLRAAGLTPIIDQPLAVTADADLYRSTVQAALADDHIDAAFVVYTPALIDGSDAVARAIDEVSGQHQTKPVVAVVLGRLNGPLLAGSRVPAFAFPEPAADALGLVRRYARWRDAPPGNLLDPSSFDIDAARQVVDHALSVRPAGTLLPLSAAYELISAYGIASAKSRAVASRADALIAADDLGYPLALKAHGIVVTGRSESGGVALDLQHADDLGGAYDRMTAMLGVAMSEAVVQQMVPSGVELIVTVTGDPAFGPVVSFGLGGAFADTISDRVTRSVPLTDVDAAAMVAESRVAGLLASMPGATTAVEDLIVRVAQLADDVPEMTELRLNPVMASGSGVWVLDVRAKFAPVEAAALPVRRLS